MSDGIRSYIEDLFKYLNVYETRYGEFDTEAFFQTYNGIHAVFQALRKQPDKAVELDQIFLDKIKRVSINSSDLRQLTIQILITYFESESNISGQSNKAYMYCRDLRPVKQDAPFFEEHLVPLLCHEGGLNGNMKLNAFLLNEMARYLNKYSRGFRPDISPEEFNSLREPSKLLILARRRAELGDQLMKDRNSLEFHLAGIGALTKLSEKSRILSHYLKEWRYLVKTSFWSKVKHFFSEIWGKFKGLFSSSKYLRLSLAQRKPAYLFYTIVIILFILLAIWVPMSWKNYTVNKLHNFENRATTTQDAISR